MGYSNFFAPRFIFQQTNLYGFTAKLSAAPLLNIQGKGYEIMPYQYAQALFDANNHKARLT